MKRTQSLIADEVLRLFYFAHSIASSKMARMCPIFSGETVESLRKTKSYWDDSLPNKSASADTFKADEKALMDSEESPDRPRSTS